MPPTPRAIICLTGSELTRGETRDLNGSFLAAQLTSLGFVVDEVTLVPDDRAKLRAAIDRARGTADLLALSGGLGPTADDLTVAALGEALRRQVVRDPTASERMRARALARGHTEATIPKNYFKQAEVLEGAEVLLNPVGLAPGMLLRGGRAWIVVLPGVPRELQAMFLQEAAPRLPPRLELTPPRILRGRILGIGESWVEARVQALGLDLERLEYGISAKPGEIVVKLLAHTPADFGLIDMARKKLEQEFGKDLVLLPEGLLTEGGLPRETDHAAIVHETLMASGATVATAESCTGGLIAKELTDRAGSSVYFRGAIVAYSNDVKVAALGVPAALLEAHGAVSEEVCAAMASGARRLLGARLAVATTGIAGPEGGTAEKPVGLVYLGIAAPGAAGEEVHIERHSFWGTREAVRRQATVRALELLRRATLGG